MKRTRYFEQLGRLACSAVLIAGATVAQADPGNHLWANIYGDITGADGNDGVNAVALDSTGNAYAAGYEWVGDGTSSAGYDAHAVKYDSDGNLVTTGWPLIYDSGIHYSQDQFVTAAVDSGDNLVLGGKGQNPLWTACQEVIIAKHNSAGVQQWKNAYGAYNPPPHDPNPLWWDCWHTLYSVDVEDSDNVFVAGVNFTGWGTTRFYDWIVFKFAPAGELYNGFPLRYNHSGSTHFDRSDYAFGIASDGAKDFTVTGWVGVAGTGITVNHDWHVRKYEHVDTDTDTIPDTVNLLWSDTYSGTTLRNDAAYQPAIDSNGDIIVIGYTNKGSDNSTNANYDWLIIKYAKDGDGIGGATRLWTKTYESAAGRSENTGLAAVVVDEHDNVYVGGYERDSSSNLPLWRLEYRDGVSGDLLQQWVWSSMEGGIAALALRDGKLAITGSRKNTAGDVDWYTQLYEITTADVMLRDKAAIWAGKRMHGVLHEPVSFSGIYGDVAVDDYAAYWIEQISTDTITEGCDSGNTLYCPKDTVTKVQAVKLILKSAGYTASSPTADPFADVTLSHPDVGWVDQAKQLDITSGCGDGANFCPEEVLTEEGFQQMADGVF